MSHRSPAETSELLGGLSPEKRRLLLQKIMRERAGSTSEGISARTSSGPAPLSFAQRRLWLVDRLEPGSAAYNVPYVLRLRGELDVAALQRSLNELVRRHEVLRTVFEERDGEPVQVVHAPAPVAVPVVDLRGVPGQEAEREAGWLADAEGFRGFDLARGPLLRCTLLRLGDAEHVLCCSLHHIVSDAWSMEVLVREVSTLYGAFTRGEAARLPELPIQYADYAAWQRERLAGKVLDEQLAYWRERLAGAPPLLEIPTDHPRAAVPGARTGSCRFVFPERLSRELRALSQRERTTLFMTVLAGWQVLLGRYAGQDDVVVGSPVSGRTRTELEGLIGFFLNMLALRGELGGDATWTELLGQTR
ncbi:MAG TPA: condensation domain-containing protein, partial [Longimicrobiaceae bacterium]|nr:condensation domain-containing protein [Longimicrobiaceae bacterium]